MSEQLQNQNKEIHDRHYQQFNQYQHSKQPFSRNHIFPKIMFRKHLHEPIILHRGEEWAHTTSITSPPFIEVLR
jgi:uncharacterized Zn-finger protein